MENKELGIYIHIPFCKQKCYYCDFVSFSNKQQCIKPYIEAIKKELMQYFKDIKIFDNYNVTTIYIGGGTPSYIDCKYIVEILKLLEMQLKHNQTKFEDIEITIEINPGTVDEEKLTQYKNAKINRLSIGLQSTNHQLLNEIGRIHTVEQFFETYKLARKVGFDNINVDLMIGLPNQKMEDIKNSLKQIIRLQPTHISVYSLIIEEGTVIDKLIQEKQLTEMDENLERNMYWYVKYLLELHEYTHYEISNFAKEGRMSKHNLNCWLQKEYIGIGTAAHSYLNGIRYTNCPTIEEYIQNLEKVESMNLQEKDSMTEFIQRKYEVEEVQNLEDKKKEYMLLGLRKIEGVQISKFKEKYLDNPIFLFRKQLERLVNEKLIIIDGDYIKLTNKGLDFANIVWEEFI